MCERQGGKYEQNEMNYEQKAEAMLDTDRWRQHGFELVDVEYVKEGRQAGIFEDTSTSRAGSRSMTAKQ